MLYRGLDTEKEGARARILSDIGKLKTATLAEAKEIIARLQYEGGRFPELAFLIAAAAEYVRVMEVKANANNPTLQDLQGKIGDSLWEIIEKERKLIPIKAAIEKEFGDTEKLVNQLNSPDMGVASLAMEELLKRNSPDRLDNFAQNVVNASQIRDEQIRGFEEIRALNGGRLDEGMNKKYEALKAENVSERTRFEADMAQRMRVQVAANLADELVAKGLIEKDEGQKNAVRINKIMERNPNLKEEIAQGAKKVSDVTYANPNERSACSSGLHAEAGRIFQAHDHNLMAQLVKEELAQEKEAEKTKAATPSQATEQDRVVKPAEQTQEGGKKEEAMKSTPSSEVQPQAIDQDKVVKPVVSAASKSAEDKAASQLQEGEPERAPKSSADNPPQLSEEEVRKQEIERARQEKAAKKAKAASEAQEQPKKQESKEASLVGVQSQEIAPPGGLKVTEDKEKPTPAVANPSQPSEEEVRKQEIERARQEKAARKAKLAGQSQEGEPERAQKSAADNPPQPSEEEVRKQELERLKQEKAAKKAAASVGGVLKNHGLKSDSPESSPADPKSPEKWTSKTHESPGKGGGIGM